MKCTIISQIVLLGTIVFASNSMLFLAAGRTSERGGKKEVKEMLLSAATCPTTCKDENGKHCCTK